MSARGGSLLKVGGGGDMYVGSGHESGIVYPSMCSPWRHRPRNSIT